MAKKCFKCGRDTKLGYMDNLRSPVCWKPKEYKQPLFPFIKRDRRLIQLGDGDFLHGGRVDAYYCSNCQIVFIDDLRPERS